MGNHNTNEPRMLIATKRVADVMRNQGYVLVSFEDEMRPGASGGPLINEHGQVVAVMSNGFRGRTQSYFRNIVHAEPGDQGHGVPAARPAAPSPKWWDEKKCCTGDDT